MPTENPYPLKAMDLNAFASMIANCAGLKPSQAPGLAILLGIVWRNGHDVGVQQRRSGSAPPTTAQETP